MALYRYVANKEDLLCAMADEALSEAAMPSTDMAWDEWYVEVTLRYWSVMGRYSGLAAYVLTRGPVLQAPNSLAATERMFTVLLDAGFEPGEAALLWQTAHAFLSGMVLLSQGRSRRSDSARPHLGGETSPGVRAVFESLYAVPDEQALEAGLRRLLSGFTPRPRRG
jgi:AcrR family transcriptional regulator